MERDTLPEADKASNPMGDKLLQKADTLALPLSAEADKHLASNRVVAAVDTGFEMAAVVDTDFEMVVVDTDFGVSHSAADKDLVDYTTKVSSLKLHAAAMDCARNKNLMLLSIPHSKTQAICAVKV